MRLCSLSEPLSGTAAHRASRSTMRLTVSPAMLLPSYANAAPPPLGCNASVSAACMRLGGSDV
eukprot:6394658-Prymnesium_polylepis.1